MNIFSAKICNKKTTCSCVLMIFESYLDILISYFTSRTRTYWFVVFDFTVCALTTYIWIRFSAWVSALEFYTSLEIDNSNFWMPLSVNVLSLHSLLTFFDEKSYLVLWTIVMFCTFCITSSKSIPKEIRRAGTLSPVVSSLTICILTASYKGKDRSSSY